jgi:large subunit ribosomal protein L9
VVEAKAGAQGRLYGSLTTSDVVTAVSKQLGVNVDRRDLDITEPVRQVGSYHVSARLHRAVTATITVEVRALGSG